jgi:uncharacterized protein (TIGR02284 family)
MSDLADDLKSLHTALVDSRHGYQEALDDADGKGMTPLFRSMIDLRTAHINELDSQLQALGEAPDRDGSFMSTVHRTVIKVRSVLTGLDERILPGLIDGEQRIVGYYDEVLKSAPAGELSRLLQAQRSAVQSMIAEMKGRVPA